MPLSPAIFDEASDGDISNDPSNPQPLQLANGNNRIRASVVAPDLDYITVNIPSDHVLSSIALEDYMSSGARSFIGVQAGSVFTGEGLFTLLENVLASFSTVSDRGLPIGALTSQYFANYYLDEFQRALRKQPGVIDELRYMDDHWVGCASKPAAKETAAFARDWLKQHRQLIVKPVQIQRSAIGLPFCGFRVSSSGLRMGRRRLRAIKKHYEKIGGEFSNGYIDELQAQQRLTSVTSLASPGYHKSAMRRIIANSGINDVCC